MARIKYIRVSTREQNTARQETDTEKFDRVYIEKASGKNADRPELKAMLDYVREGDIVEVESYSRIARNTQDLLNIVSKLSEKGVDFVSQKEKIDTSSPSGRLMLTIFAGLAQFERECLLERQAEGIAIAKREGRMGRPEIQPCADRLHCEGLAGRQNDRCRSHEAGKNDKSDVLSEGQNIAGIGNRPRYKEPRAVFLFCHFCLYLLIPLYRNGTLYIWFRFRTRTSIPFCDTVM